MKTVADLIAELAECDQSLPVLVQGDPEGNAIRVLATVYRATIEEQYGEHFETKMPPEDLTDALREQGYTEEDVGHGRRCIVIAPGYPESRERSDG